MTKNEKRIEGIMSYYHKYLQTSTMGEVKDKVTSEFGKKTRQKVSELVEQAHIHGVILGLTEALNIIKIYGEEEKAETK